jgi:hypothetical protein
MKSALEWHEFAIRPQAKGIYGKKKREYSGQNEHLYT